MHLRHRRSYQRCRIPPILSIFILSIYLDSSQDEYSHADTAHLRPTHLSSHSYANPTPHTTATTLHPLPIKHSYTILRTTHRNRIPHARRTTLLPPPSRAEHPNKHTQRTPKTKHLAPPPRPKPTHPLPTLHRHSNAYWHNATNRSNNPPTPGLRPLHPKTLYPPATSKGSRSESPGLPA